LEGLAPKANHTCIASLAGICHQRMLVERSRLVIRGLEDGWAAHGGFGGGDDGEVFPGYAQKNLPSKRERVSNCEPIKQTAMSLHDCDVIVMYVG
jgi:hypothetical protein